MATTERKEILRDSVQYISSRYLAQIFGFVTGIATKRFVGPMLTGVWQLLEVILNYCEYATLGASRAAYRRIPYYKGRKEFEKAAQIQNEVFTVSLMMACLPAAGMLLYAFVVKEAVPHYFFVGLMFIASYIVIKRIDDYYTILLRAHKSLGLASLETVLTAVVDLGLVFLLVRPYKIYGLYLASFISTLLGLVFVHWRAKYQFRLTLSKEGVTEVLAFGLPLLLLGICVQTIKNLDKILIAKYLGVTALGNYAIALMVNNYALGFPNMFMNVLSPRMIEKFGERGSPEAIKNYLGKSVFAIGLLIGFVNGLLTLCVPWLVYWLLPQFVGGIAAMKIFVWGAYFFAIGGQAQVFLVAIEKHWHAIGIAFLGMVTAFVFNLSFIKLGWGIEGVALGITLSALVYNVALIACAKSRFAKIKEILLFFATNFGILLYFMTLTLVFSAWGDEREFLSVVMRAVLYLLFSLPAFWVMDKKTHLISTAYAIYRDKFTRAQETNGAEEVEELPDVIE